MYNIIPPMNQALTMKVGWNLFTKLNAGLMLFVHSTDVAMM